jgi:hypothetical protein
MPRPIEPPTPPRKRPRKNAARKAVPTPAVFEPAYEAHRLRLTGLPWREDAGLTGYATDATCMMSVTAYLQRAALAQTADMARLALTTELDRLDAQQSRWWTKALDGDEKAANVVLKIIAQRSRLLGLEDADRRAGSTARTIVITGSAEEYVAQLREITETVHDPS